MDEKSYTIKYYPEEAYGVIAWNKYVTPEEFRSSCLEFLKIIGERPIRKVLQDARKLNIISNGDQNWMAENISPVPVQLGLKYSAVVIPRNLLARISVEDMVNSAGSHNDQTVTVQYFETLEAAEEWLKDK